MSFEGVSGVPTAEIITHFVDGKLWVEQDRPLEQGYKMSGYSTYGVPVRVGLLKTIDRVINLEAYISGHPERIATPLTEAKISGDTVLVVLRRQDFGVNVTSGAFTSGTNALGAVSGLTSGIGFMAELASGLVAASALISIKVGVIGY